MAEHFPRQYASIVSGSLGIDGRRPYPGRLDLLLPLEARARSRVFTQHGIPIREILRLAAVYHPAPPCERCPACGNWPTRIVGINSETGEEISETMPETGCPECGRTLKTT